MFKKINLIVIGCCLFIAKNFYAQPNHTFDFKTNYTFVMPHHKKMIHLTEKHFPYFEINYIKNTNGNKPWHHLYNYPRYGFALHVNNFGKSQVLGQAYALYPYLYSDIIETDNFNLSLKFGAGLAYLTKKFDKDSNPKNVAISTNLNIFINFGAEFQQNITENFMLFEGIGVTHYSNGALRMPNTGINLPYVSLGFRYCLNNQKFEINTNPVLKQLEKRTFFSVFLAAGLKEIYPSYGKKYPAFTISGSYNLQPSLKRIFNVNLDFFYSLANAETLKRKNIEYSNLSLIRPGVSIGHEFIFDNTNFIFQTGRYFYAKDNSDGYIYNRIGFKRYFSDNFFLNITLKSHLFVADFLEFGTGFKF